MRIEELAPEQPITILVIAGEKTLEFPSSVLDTIPHKHMILAAPILKDDKIISFNGKGILVHLIATFSDQKPHVFQNVTINSAKRDDNSFCYTITSPAESKEFNRRGAYRCYIGTPTRIRIGSGRTAIECTIKDISTTGFAFTVSSSEVELSKRTAVHAVLNDQSEELSQKYSFHLLGSIVRSYTLENGNVVYGCQFTGKVPGLDKYLMEKERIRLQKSRGNAGSPPRK